MSGRKWRPEWQPPESTNSLRSGVSLLYVIRTLRVGHLPYLWHTHVGALVGILDAVSATTLRRLLVGPTRQRQRMKVRAFGEQTANPNSRVTLSGRRDLFDRRGMRLDWRLSEADVRSIRQAHAILGREVQRAGVRELDPDCLVHGTTNLFAAGSSVLPTGGYANPTLTIVALAIRLAAHLKTG
jgi:hypothetical protein